MSKNNKKKNDYFDVEIRKQQKKKKLYVYTFPRDLSKLFRLLSTYKNIIKL